MKSIFISYNQAYHPMIIRILNNHNERGYSSWQSVTGQGSRGGEPHLGSHAWPTMNSAILAIVPDEKVNPILAQLRELDEATPDQGLRAFVWNIEDAI